MLLFRSILFCAHVFAFTALAKAEEMPAERAEITVFAAASLGTALEKIAPLFEEETGRAVVISLAASSALARQIEAGAPADVYISANPDWMDHLETQGLIAPFSRRTIAGNRLVLVAHGGGEKAPIKAEPDLTGLLKGGRLATALTDAVPLGLYAKAALIHLGQWNDTKPHLAEADNARAALAFVAIGAAAYGIVYASDAKAEPRVTTIASFPPESHPPILYPAAAITGKNIAASRRFLDFLNAPAARALFVDAGFKAPVPGQ